MLEKFHYISYTEKKQPKKVKGNATNTLGFFV